MITKHEKMHHRTHTKTVIDRSIDLTALGGWYQSRRRRRRVKSQPAGNFVGNKKKNWTKLYKCMYVGWRRRERGNKRQRHKSWKKRKRSSNTTTITTTRPHESSAQHSSSFFFFFFFTHLGLGLFVCLFVCCVCVRCKSGVESWAASRGSTPVLFLLLPQSQLRQFGVGDF